MAGRLPFNLSNHTGQNPLHEAQLRAALGLPVGDMDASIYMQQQRELQREFQIRQLLLQEQLSGQSRLDAIVAETRLNQLRDGLKDHPELQQHYSQLLLQERLQGQHHQDPTLLARAQLQHHLAQSQAQAHLEASSLQHHVAQNTSLSDGTGGNDAHAQQLLRNIADESLSGNATRKDKAEKRGFAKPESATAGTRSPKRRPRSGTDDTTESKKKKKKKEKAAPKKSKHSEVSSALDQLGMAATEAANTALKPSAQDLLDFAQSTPQSEEYTTRGSVVDLLQAAETEEKADTAVSILADIKRQDVVLEEWKDDSQDQGPSDIQRAKEKGDSIELPNFTSVLPQLPEEPEVLLPQISPGKKRKKNKNLLESDLQDDKSKAGQGGAITEVTTEAESMIPTTIDSTNPIDPWWPSVSDIKKERKMLGELQDEDNYQEAHEDILEQEMPFRVNLPRVKERFANEITPGVLEKLPHCRVHQMNVRRGPNTAHLPELVHCFQVTELYPKALVVCCSHCGTWRHAVCGGHHKPYSIRECIETPFTAVCDRCHTEEKILRDYPSAKKRLDRQRNEQLRRAMATSATMRQLAFSKHGGSYKWPLGSVSTTHIGGHTRSVHVRQEKAEKQWKDMIAKLSKDYGSKVKERVRVRTRELEKLLSYVEDAEGQNERHNMLLFLLQDTIRKVPVGFEKPRVNIFDPAEDDDPSEDEEAIIGADSFSALYAAATNGENIESEKVEAKAPSVCAMNECSSRARFDSIFCSDACGVASMEADLLRTFNYLSDIHPSLLRC